jgi:hypothetical protein
MKNLKVYCFLITMIIAVGTMSSCASNTSKTDDQDVKVMDSVSTDLDKSNDELDAQNQKVEASLEKLDKEENTVK